MVQNKYRHILSTLNSLGYTSPIYTDPLYTLVKGSDASFYRLIPKMVVQVNNEKEVQAVLEVCRKASIPVTFKAGGTSLSGQTITDSVLIEIGPKFSKGKIFNDGRLATFQPGIRGGSANNMLAKYGRKIGPNPASINSAKIGGIVANNSSGASYGISTNSYNTILGMRIIFADGALLDTSDRKSREHFKLTHDDFLHKIENLRDLVHSKNELVNKIRSKYELKNTCGYGINSFVDFSDPIDIVEHLMIGSEGTLGFISEVTFETVIDHPHKACSFVFFSTLKEAAHAIMPLRDCAVSAAELMDRNALRSVENNSGMPAILKELNDQASALLIETSAPTNEQLSLQVEEIKFRLKKIPTLYPLSFTGIGQEYHALWKVRKGLFTSAAATRPQGTASIIEDVAFPGETLGDAMDDLKDLLNRYNYTSAVIWGHLLDGNIHFLISPDFQQPDQLDNYKRFMHELAALVVKKYNGSLKAEHGTGRNMAPFVAYEWGDEIYEIMKQIKTTFDPDHILNPGVIINDDPEVFAKNIKPLPVANPIIDHCIECGFCESICPSREITLTPRQRIVAFREMVRLSDQPRSKEMKKLSKAFSYHVEESCATDGLCSINCPVGIDTGKLIKELRFEQKSIFANYTSSFIAKHFSLTVTLVRWILGSLNGIQKVVPTGLMKWFANSLHNISDRAIPLWNEYLPKPAPTVRRITKDTNGNHLPNMVYFPSCINRLFGISKGYDEKSAIMEKTSMLLQKSGYSILYPPNLSNLCCGMAFDSKGFVKQGMQKLIELEKTLLKISENGKYPILCEMSPCVSRMKEKLDKRLKLYDPVQFTLSYLTEKLDFHPLPVTVAIYSTCSNTKMGLEDDLFTVVNMCADKVVKEENTGCCGWAGDKGFTIPKLNGSALKHLKEELPDNLEGGYSTSRTCEIGLSLHSGITFKSIFYLIDKATSPKKS